MSAVDLIPTIIESMEREKSSIGLFLATGGAKSWDEYCRCVGEYSALQKTLSDIKDIEQRFIES
jgi:hypothetical protein